MKRTIIIILALLGILAVTASASSFAPTFECAHLNGYIKLCRVRDAETGALCYVLDGGYQDHSISCLLPAKEIPPPATNLVPMP